jgi:hypothetical protein
MPFYLLALLIGYSPSEPRHGVGMASSDYLAHDIHQVDGSPPLTLSTALVSDGDALPLSALASLNCKTHKGRKKSRTTSCKTPVS